MSGDRDPDATARRVIDANHDMTLGTLDADGRPRLSPVYYTAARYSDFYWVSSPQAHHSRNLIEHREVELVILDSTPPSERARRRLPRLYGKSRHGADPWAKFRYTSSSPSTA
jgi:nitroimidazol reductase NimA-like FMN-containing flavoprotein (pyridoxamine 5'-phosphate oxidase superfamily)